jgi:hypothetical protein
MREFNLIGYLAWLQQELARLCEFLGAYSAHFCRSFMVR